MLWHPDTNTSNIFITTAQDYIISYCRSSASHGANSDCTPCGAIHISHIHTGERYERRSPPPIARSFLSPPPPSLCRSMHSPSPNASEGQFCSILAAPARHLAARVQVNASPKFRATRGVRPCRISLRYSSTRSATNSTWATAPEYYTSGLSEGGEAAAEFFAEGAIAARCAVKPTGGALSDASSTMIR